MAFVNPGVSDFQNQFYRDFNYGSDISTSVTDQDIANSFVFTNATISQDLFPDQGTYTLGYLLLSAHFMVTSLRASSQGINGQYDWLQNSKSVGSVSTGSSIPQYILDNPNLSQYSKTNYGVAYLSLIWPLLVGPTFTAFMPAHAL